jgi:hypothetical protein
MTREQPTGSASAGQQQIGKTTTVLGTRCFSGLTGSHGFSRFFGRVPSQGSNS